MHPISAPLHVKKYIDRCLFLTVRYPTGDRRRSYVMSVRARPEVVIRQKQMKEQGQRKEQLRQVVEAGADAVLIFGGAVLVQGLLG